MKDVDVDVVGIEARQGAVYLAHDVVAREPDVVGAIADTTKDFGGDHQVIAVALEDASEDLFGGTGVAPIIFEAVDIGAVDEVNTEFDGAFDSAFGFCSVGLAAKAEAIGQARDFKAGIAEVYVVHDMSLN